MKKLIALTLFIFALSVSVFGQEKFSAKVHLYVQTGDRIVQNEMFSYMSRELRSLGDVALVDSGKDGGTYEVSILITNTSVNSRKVGYAVSRTVTKYSLCQSTIKQADGSNYIFSYDDLRISEIDVVPTDGLKQLAQEIVAGFDTQLLQSDRKNFNLLHSATKN